MEAPRDVALIVLDNPPVNGLSHAVRSAVVGAVDAANADPAVRAIVIAGAGKLFSGGADVREFGTPRQTAEPTLLTVIRIVEASPLRSSVVDVLKDVTHPEGACKL